MKKTKLIAVGLIVVAGVYLAGCSHKNPLMQQKDKHATAEFLVSSVQAVERKMNLTEDPHGFTYRDCMSGRAKAGYCAPFYKEMLKNVRKNKQYSGVTLSQLTDLKFWGYIKEAYARATFHSI